MDWYSSIEFNYKELKEIWDAFETFFRIRQGVTGASLNFPTQKFAIFWKAMLEIASQNFPELNALNFFSVTVKDMGLLDSQREINLVIFHLNHILIHLNIYSVLK